MNNIEILEEQIKYWEDLIKTTEEINPFYTWIKDDKIEERTLALKNLIQENKELKERYLKLESDRFWDNVIPKSKVKEKIEELEEEYKILQQTSDFIIADTIQPKIKVLQELLEEGE